MTPVAQSANTLFFGQIREGDLVAGANEKQLRGIVTGIGFDSAEVFWFNPRLGAELEVTYTWFQAVEQRKAYLQLVEHEQQLEHTVAEARRS